ncbi:hypothetical protein K7H20_13790 [Salipiger manganoxidans]|uniref:DnaT-like ssDNA-binding protein n=1 Tax=Salipiger marinus TaxID=555512 RepID=UPI001E41443D|nr:DnaT-like ssDNA-binding protein [Salipiger manganoxidans]MCD1619137.1 hypothetical protein [Salipiger manganoxidans]
MAAYGTDEGFTAWLSANGHTLPGSLTAAVLRERASAYIDALYGPRFVGKPVAWDQDLAWPRLGATAWGLAIPSDEVPGAVVNAVYAAAFAEAGSPGLLARVVDPAGRVKSAGAGPAKVEFFEADGQYLAVILSGIDGALAPLLIGGIHGRGVGVMVV